MTHRDRGGIGTHIIRESGLSRWVWGPRSESNPGLTIFVNFQILSTIIHRLSSINSWLITRWSYQQLVDKSKSLSTIHSWQRVEDGIHIFCQEYHHVMTLYGGPWRGGPVPPHWWEKQSDRCLHTTDLCWVNCCVLFFVYYNKWELKRRNEMGRCYERQSRMLRMSRTLTHWCSRIFVYYKGEIVS